MGTHHFDYFADMPPLRAAVLTHKTVREDTQRVRISFSGEIDLSSADLVEAAVADALRSADPHHLEVDLAGVRFIDSIGIRALLRSKGQASEEGCHLAVVNTPPMIYRVLELTGLVATLDVTPMDDQPLADSADG
jgi:anti-sigma B factor antagonist